MIYTLDINPITKKLALLESNGITCCLCCEFSNVIGFESCLHGYYDQNILNQKKISMVHGIYGDEYEPNSWKAFDLTKKEYKMNNKELIECKTFDEFISKIKEVWKIK